MMLLMIVASAVATTYPIGYEDNSCEYVKHGWVWVLECDQVDKETSVDVPETDLTPVNDRLYALENNGGFGYSRFIHAMQTDVLDWLKGIFVQADDYDQDKIEQQETDREQNKRIFACEQALGMTEGYQ